MPTYHSRPSAAHSAPNDATEHDRLEAQSCGIKTCLVRTHLALLEPGGWAELQEFELVPRDADGTDIMDALPSICHTRTLWAGRGSHSDCGTKLKQWLRSAVFVDVHSKAYAMSCSNEP